MSHSVLVGAAAALTMATVLAGCAASTGGATGRSAAGGGPTPSVTEPAAGPLATDLPRTPPPGSSATTCVDWVHFETPRDAAADSGAVLRGTVVEQEGTVQMYGAVANRWSFEVEDVLERPEPARTGMEPQPELRVAPGERISVVSTPETCGGQETVYPPGDPLDPATGLGGPDGTVIILLSAASGTGEGGVEDPHLITPFQGVLTPAADGTLPQEWPAP